MSTILQPCPPDVKEQADELIRQYHEALIAAEVTIAYLFAANPDGDAIKHHGYKAAALCKVNSYQDRIEGKADVTIKIDKDWWDGASEEERDALLDHEIHHVEVQTNDAGAFEYDDANRPKLKTRKHDVEIGGFYAIAKRHGRHAVEVQAIEAVNTRFVQMELEFAE